MGNVLDVLGGPAGAISAGIGVVQTVGGLIGQSRATKEINKLMGQRKAFITPEETYQILQATQQNAQTGLGAQTLNYLTGNADKAFSSSIGAATLLGADVNDLSAIFEQRVMENMKIGAEDQTAQMANFAKYLGALNTVAENKSAEQVSKDNLIKDRIQAAAAKGGDATKNISNGLSSITGAIAAGQQMQLFNKVYGIKKPTVPSYSNQLKTTTSYGDYDYNQRDVLGNPSNNPYLA